MKNVNKNAMHALATFSDSYLMHHHFPAFSPDGSHPFTIEVTFVYQDSNYGSLYCQEDGMNLGIREGRPYFTHPGLGDLSVPGFLKLEPSYWHFLAVVFDGSTLKMYVHGFEVASLNVSKKSFANTKDFCIGKGFRGYIGCVRVLSKALTAEEVMQDQGGNFPENAACELCTDFSSAAYKDISANAMALWRTGHDTHCANVVNCTVLDRNGLYTRNNPIDYRSGFSLTGKLYADLSQKGNFYIYCLHGDSGPYLELYLTEQEDGYHLALAMNGTELISGTRIQGLRWTDYAVTVDIGAQTACLYLDGVKCGEQTYSGLQSFEKAKAIIGGKYFTGRASYDESFAGLLDYCAEFACVLPDRRIDSYAEEQPYLFAENITALMLFGWGEPEDIYENMPLGEYGGGYYAVMADTNHVNAPIGVEWYVPDEDDEYWSGLSAYEKWEDELLRDVISEIIEGLTGIPMKAEHHEKQKKSVRMMTGGEVTHRLTRLKDLSDVPLDTFSPPPSPENLYTTTQGVAINIHGGRVRAFAGNAGMPRATGLWAGLRGFFAKYWKQIVEGALVVGGIVAAIGIIAKHANKKSPKNDKAKLAVKDITWNHKGDPTNGSIHFHDSVDNLNSPDSMVYAPNDTCIEIKGVFVPSMLKEIKVDIKVMNMGTADYSGCLKLKDPDGTVIAASQSFSVAKQSSTTVVLTITSGQIAESGYDQGSDYFNITYTQDDQDIFIIRCDYAYYTLLGEPISPWNNGRNEYNKFNLGYVNIPLLEVCTEKFPMKMEEHVSADKDRLIKTIISGMNECKKLTYALQGEPHFSTPQLGFKFIKFVKAMQKEGVSYLNCADCATIVSALSAMHGRDYPMTILGVPYGRMGQSFFYCNQIQAITAGEPVWKYPFDWNGTKGYGGFSFHMVNRSNEPGISRDTKIYDACLKVDGGNYPGQAYSDKQTKIAKQPLGMKAYGSESAFVKVAFSEAYTADVYRERLVFNGNEACFCSAAYRVLQIDTVVTRAAKVADMAQRESAFNIEQIFKGNSHVTEWSVLDDMYGEAEWSFMYDGRQMEICRYTAEGQNAETAVRAVMRQFAAPDSKDLSTSYPDSCCIAISDSCYVIWKEGCVYRILGAHAKEAADCIYGA